MPRKGHVSKREVLPDPLYKSKEVTKLINSIMLDGKKGVAQKIVYGAFEKVAEKTGKAPIEAYEEAMAEFEKDPVTISHEDLMKKYAEDD